MRRLKDRRLKSIFLGRYRSGRERWRAMTFLVVALLTLYGLGQGLVALYEGVTTTDQVNRLATLVSGPPRGVLPVTVVDIDDATHQAWGSQPRTPPGALAELIAIVRERQAMAIMVDIALSTDDRKQVADPVLLRTLAGHDASSPPLLLIRQVSFTRSPDGKNIAEAYRETGYDDAVRGKGNVIWVSALPQLGSDRVVRQIRLWQTHCRSGPPEVHPAAPMALVAALGGAQRLAELRNYLGARAKQECRRPDEPAVVDPERGWPQFRGSVATIPYTIDAEGRALGRNEIAMNGSPAELVRRVSAGVLVNYVADIGRAERVGAIHAEPFAGRVVLIGASHGATGDIHMTPFGSMAGAMIIANALAASRSMVETPEPGDLARHGLAFSLFVFFGVIAARLNAAPAALVIGVLGTAALALFSRSLGFGAAIEAVATGLAAFGLFKLLDSLVSIVFDWRRGQGWRAILKPPQSTAS
jgi:CHASE2 domain-containing sensor protein